jgi:hypothetical protein
MGGHSQNAKPNLATTSSYAPYFKERPTLGMNPTQKVYPPAPTLYHLIIGHNEPAPPAHHPLDAPVITQLWMDEPQLRS